MIEQTGQDGAGCVVMAKLDPMKHIDFLQKGDDVSSRNLRKELLDSANVEVSGSNALVEQHGV